MVPASTLSPERARDQQAHALSLFRRQGRTLCRCPRGQLRRHSFSARARLDLSHRTPTEGMRELVVFTWKYFLDHPEFLGILSTENLHKARFLKRSARIFELHSPLVAEISGLLDRGAAAGDFRPGCDPVKIYMSIAALGSFFLTNRWTLSTIFRRNLSDKSEIDAWGEHIVDVIFAYLRP